MKYSVTLEAKVTYSRTVELEASSYIEALNLAERNAVQLLNPSDVVETTKFTAVKVDEVTNLNPPAT
jgi:hypothetical protein